MTKRTLCNFLCWLGGLGEKVVISVKNKKDCMICTDMSEFVICWKRRKEIQNEEEEIDQHMQTEKEVYL